MTRRLSLVALATYLGLLVLVGATRAGAYSLNDRKPAPHDGHHVRVVGTGQVRFDGHGPEWWARRARAWHRAYSTQRRVLLRSPQVTEAIGLACATYGNCSTLWRKARCESGLSPYAKNRSSDASGLFQFMPGTFASTPFGRLSIWSPYASAMAAGWMHVRGRGGEWVCS